MKHLIYLTISLFVAFSFASCNDNKIDEAWKDANIEAYNKKKADSAYKDVRDKAINKTGPEGVLYKVIEQGTGTEHPLQTSVVKVLYSGKYYNDSYFDIGTRDNNVPVSFSVTSTVRGFSYALQNMVVGDKWEIVIPYYLGYGESPSAYQTDIPAYTTLFFEVKLVDIITYLSEQQQ